MVDSDVSLLASGQLNAKNKAKVDTEKSSDEMKSVKIWIDPSSCCLALYAKLFADQVFSQQSPLALAKALKVICTYCFSSSILCDVLSLLILFIIGCAEEPGRAGWLKKSTRQGWCCCCALSGLVGQ